jgi:uncharacterized protein
MDAPTPQPQLIPRLSAGRIAVALEDTPVVMVTGPRQAGKTTLVREFVDDQRTYVTLDDDTVLAGVREDPAAFLRGVDRIVIDEVQRAPELLRSIKQSVDRDRRAGRFLLTGSANVLALPRVSESLAGRMEVVTLLPLSLIEMRRTKPSFLSNAFAGKVGKASALLVGDDLTSAILTGGYPEMLGRSGLERRQTWAREYMMALVQRDIRDIADIQKLDQMTRLLLILAQHSGRLVNLSQIGGQIGLDDKTVGKYVTILEQLFILRRIDPWFRNRLKRLVKTPRLHFFDSGLLAAILGATPERIAADRSILGPLLETFVFSEVAKQIRWFDQPCTLHHYRDKEQDEIDLIVESSSGGIVGIEVKAAATVTASDFKGLKKLAAACGDDLKLGVVLYDSDQVVPFGDRMFAAPVSCLWG